MRVGIVGPSGTDCLADNIGDALIRMGHRPFQLGSAFPSRSGMRLSKVTALSRQVLPFLDERAQKGLGDRALDLGCDVVICVDLWLLPSVVRRIRQARIPVGFWFPDCVANLGRALMILAPYSALFFKEPHLVRHLRALQGLPCHYLPEACNPRWHRPLVPAAAQPYLVLAGSMYPSRIRLLDRLIGAGIPIRLYGPGFPRWSGPSLARGVHTGTCVFREEKARVFRSAAGVLNNLHPAEVSGVNARLFEAAGSGAAVITEYRPALPDLFDIGTEVLAFDDFDQLVDQCRRVLDDAALAAKIGDAAARRAHSSHTYEHRLGSMLDILGATA